MTALSVNSRLAELRTNTEVIDRIAAQSFWKAIEAIQPNQQRHAGGDQFIDHAVLAGAATVLPKKMLHSIQFRYI